MYDIFFIVLDAVFFFFNVESSFKYERWTRLLFWITGCQFDRSSLSVSHNSNSIMCYGHIASRFDCVQSPKNLEMPVMCTKRETTQLAPGRGQLSTAFAPFRNKPFILNMEEYYRWYSHETFLNVVDQTSVWLHNS